MAFEDKALVCRECGAEFIFSAGEQEFFQEKGFQHPPSRCPECRAKRRASEGRASFGDRQMFKVICSDCGREALVPFEPRTDKPVYCQTCFAKHRGR